MKKLLCIVISLAFVLPMAACHGSVDRAAFDVPASFDTDTQTEIVFWAKNDTNKRQTDIYEKAIADFEALYPNIKVKLRLYTDYGRIYNDVITNIATDTTPNVCITYPDHIATYLTGENTVVPLEELMNDKKYGLGGSELRFESPKKSELVKKYLNECKLEGVTYALPYMRSGEACYINKTYVEKLGFTLPERLTWDFVWQVSEAAMEKNADGTFKVNGQKVLIPFIYKSTDNMMIQALYQMGAPYSNNQGEYFIFCDETKEFLTEISSHVKSGAFSTFKISSYPANFLNAGQCIFAIDSTAGATWMGSEAPLSDISEDALVEFETAVMPIPQFDTEKPKNISQGPSVCIFNKQDPQEVLASWLFMQYLLTDEVQIAYAQTEGYVPVTTKAQSNPIYTDYLSRGGEDNDMYYDIKIQASKLVIENTENSFVTPVFNGSASLRDAAGHLIESVAKSTRRKETIDDAYFTKLFDSTVSLYRLEEKRDAASGNTKELGELPSASAVFLISLCAVWLGIAVYAAFGYVKKRKKEK